MKRIASAALLLITLLAFAACDKAETSQSVSPSPTQTQQAVTATEAPTQAPIVTVTPAQEITQETTTEIAATPGLVVTDNPTITAPASPNVTYTIVPAPTSTLAYPGQWLEWKPGLGDEKQLNDAITKLSNASFIYEDLYYENESTVITRLYNEVDRHVREILSGYDVYVYSRVIGFADHGSGGYVKASIRLEIVAGNKMVQFETEGYFRDYPVCSVT